VPIKARLQVGIVLELDAGGGGFGREGGVEGVDFAVELLPKVLAHPAIMGGPAGVFGRCRSGFRLERLS